MEIQVVLKVLAVLLLKGIRLYSFTIPSNNDINCEYRSMTKFLQNLAANNSHIARLSSIGLTEEDREIWTIIVSDNPYHRPLLRPQVKFVGNVNGMSGPACYILLRLAKHLVEQYENEASMERKLMESIEIHIIPNLNPDGYAKAIPGSCFSGEGRLNANGINLNTNFPDVFVDQENLMLQRETEAIMRWIEQNKFIMSVSVISGVKAVSYPFDSIPPPDIIGAPVGGQPHLPPDHDIFKHLSLTYAKRAWKNEMDWYCPRLKRKFPNGIINGAEWKPQSGTMMDYNYIHGTFEIMVGVSCCRNENDTSVLNELWWQNRESLLHVIHEVQGGIRGQVLDSETYDAIEGAKLTRGGQYDYDYLEKHEGLPHIPWFTTEHGEFWRPWRPGAYKLKVEKDGYKTKEVDVVVEQRQPTFLRVELQRIMPTTTTIPLTTTTFPSVHVNIMEADDVRETTTSNYSDSLNENEKHTNKFPTVFSDNEESQDDGKSAEDSDDWKPKLSYTQHYPLMKLDHSFINLFKGVNLKSSGVILKESCGITAMFLGLVFLRFHLSAF